MFGNWFTNTGIYMSTVVQLPLTNHFLSQTSDNLSMHLWAVTFNSLINSKYSLHIYKKIWWILNYSYDSNKKIERIEVYSLFWLVYFTRHSKDNSNVNIYLCQNKKTTKKSFWLFTQKLYKMIYFRIGIHFNHMCKEILCNLSNPWSWATRHITHTLNYTCIIQL